MTKVIITALLLTTLAACTTDDEPTAGGRTITIGADVVASDTRAGQTACIDYSVLATEGFGVFASSATVGYSNDWLQNNHVTYTPTPVEDDLGIVHVHPGNWTYTAAQKNWPSTGTISFFGYAPYVAAGASEPGITAIDGTNANDPTVSYQVATSVSQCVDLLWGVKGTTGLPWLNVTSTDAPVVLTFRHALAAVGFRAQVMVDQDNNLADLNDATKTGKPGTNECKVTIKSIKLTATDEGSFWETGTLHLNNDADRDGVADVGEVNTPYWTGQSGTLNDFKLSGDAIDAKLRAPESYPSSNSEIETFMTNTTTNPGITEAANSQLVISTATGKTPAALNGKEQCWMFIPKAAQNYQVKVEYYVTYKTSDTPTYNTFDYTGANAKTIDISSWELKPDTKYYLNLVFGLKTLGLTVTATDWANTPLPVSVIIERGTSASQSLSRQQ